MVGRSFKKNSRTALNAVTLNRWRGKEIEISFLLVHIRSFLSGWNFSSSRTARINVRGETTRKIMERVG